MFRVSELPGASVKWYWRAMVANTDLSVNADVIRFLIVDDEAFIARDLSSQITRMGYAVIGTAGTAERAVALVDELRPDIILMDIHLGHGRDGILAAREIRDKYTIPSIFVTAYTDHQTLLRAQVAQPLGYLVKPVTPAALKATVMMSIAQHKIMQALAGSPAWLTSLVGQMPEGIFVVDGSGVVKFMNKAAESLTGSHTGGNALDAMLRAQDPNIESIAKASDIGGEAPARGVIRSVDGRETPVEYRAFDLGTGNKATAEHVIIVSDISERILAERLLEAEKGQLAARVASTSAELDRTKEQLRALAANLMSAQEEERRRIARQLHDDLAQQIAFIQMKSDALVGGNIGGTELEYEMMDLRGLLNSLSEQIRSLSHRLHPSTLEHLGLPVALQSLVREFQERNADTLIRVSVPEKMISLTPEVAIGVYRIAAESLRNIEKHAGAAAVSLKLFRRPQSVRLSIRDYGRGFDTTVQQQRTVLGLISMKERSLAMGGTLKICSRPGNGTLIALAVPTV